MNRWLCRLAMSGLIVCVGVLMADAQVDPVGQHPINARGVHPAHGTFSLLPWERIDTYSGNVVLTFTDIDLPGDAGMSLRLQRTYNSKDGRWRIGVGPDEIYQPHDAKGTALGNPIIITTDGAFHHTFATGTPGVYMTTDLWRWTPSANTLETPDGTTYKYWFSDNPRRPSHIEDRFGTSIDLFYDVVDGTILLTGALQYVQGGARFVELSYDDDEQLESITVTWRNPEGAPIAFPSRTWTYSSSGNTLTVQPPAGAPWIYTTTGDSLRVTTPHGGWVQYNSELVAGPVEPGSGYPTFTRRITSRESGGPEIEAGTWSFDDHGTLGTQTTVIGPSGRMDYWHREGPPQAPLLSASELRDGAELLESTTYSWTAGDAVGDDDQWYLVNFPEDPAWHKDPRPWLPDVVTTTRDGRTWTTDYNYNYGSTGFNDFLNPKEVVESGDFSRTTTYTYDNSFDGLHLGGFVTSATVTTGDEAFSTTFGYDGIGFMTSRTQYGVTTTFAPDGAGNVASATDANEHTTTYSYEWGAVKTIVTPEYPVSRSINPDGTVGSETRRGYVTVFERDDLGRETKRTPPLGAPTTTDHAANAVTATRGNMWTTTWLDGYGRPTGTKNAAEVKTAVRYDAEGRPVYTSRPFSGDFGYGVETTYDALGRPTATRDTADDATVTYEYDGLDVTITDVAIPDEPDRITVQYWEATGAPGRARLQELKDADLQSTTYTYDTLGALKDVASPGGVLRQWRYNPKHFLETETHPESGTTAYLRDEVGNVIRRTDAAGLVVRYEYDDNNRLREVKPSGRPDYDTSITYDDSDNRRTAGNGHVQSTWTFDGANRLTKRVDVIAGRTLTTEYQPDPLDRLEWIRYPEWTNMPAAVQRVVSYQYDAAGRVSKVADGGRVYAEEVKYHPSGALKSYVAGNGLMHTMSEDERGRPEVLNAGGVLQVTYGYDLASNVRSITDTRPEYSQAFDPYDNLHRLTHAVGPWGTLVYGYDAAGNRTTKTKAGVTTTYAFNDQQRLVTAIGATREDFVVNGIGQLTADGRGTYSYTPTGMLEQATLGTGLQMTFRYDGDDMRKIRSWGTNTRYYLHGQGGNLLREVKPDGSSTKWLRDYIYLGSRLIASVKDATSVSVSGDTSVVEGTGTGSTAATLRLTLSTPEPLPADLTVTVAVSGGTASSPSDFAPLPASVTWNAGSMGGEIQIPVSVVRDSLYEGTSETITIDITPIGQPRISHVLTIVDDDPRPALSVLELTNQPENYVWGGGFGMPARVRLSAVSGMETRFRLQTRGVTASIPQDLSAFSSTDWFAIPAGLQEVSIRIPIVNDCLVEPAEKFYVDLVEVVNASVGQATAPGWILNDDQLPVVTVEAPAILEGPGVGDNAFLQVPVRVSCAYPEAIAVTYSTADGTAVAGLDYVAVSGASFTIPANTDTRLVGYVATSAVVVLGDRLWEADETFWLALQVSPNAQLATSVVAASIRDDDSAAWTPRTRWYLGEGATGRIDEDVLIFNPNDTDVTVDVNFLRPDGTLARTRSATVRGRRRATIRVNDEPGLSSGDVAVEVAERNATKDIVVERSLYWLDGTRRGGHNALGVVRPSTTWYLAEGHTGFENYVTVFNPGTVAATVNMTFTTPSAVVPYVVTVPARGRQTVCVNTVEGLGGIGVPFATKVVASQSVVVDRSVYWSLWEGGHSTVGVTAPQTTWRFAEGSTLTSLGLLTYFQLYNPGTTAATVTLTYLTDDRRVVPPHTLTLPAGGRQTIATQDNAALYNASFATVMTSSVPIVAERSMYWGGWVEGHASAGASPGLKWWFAEGMQGTFGGQPTDTYYLILNEHDRPIDIAVEFVREGELLPPVTRTVTVPARSRLTLYAGDIADLSGHRFAAKFDATASSPSLPFVVERAIYWGAGWFGGHGSVGTPWQ